MISKPPYICAVQANPKWGVKPVHEHSEIGLMIRVCDAHKRRPLIQTCFLGLVPAQVAMDDKVTVVLILRCVQRGSGVIGQGWTLGDV